MSAGVVSSDSIVSQLMDGSSLGDYLKGAQRINGSLAAASTSLRLGMKYDSSTVNSMAAIEQIQNQSTDDLNLHASLIVAAQARDNLAAAQKSYREQVVSANANFDQSMDQTFGGAGYTKESGHYFRRSIIESTITGNIYEDQSVDTYRAFTVPGFEVKTTLDDTSLKGLDAIAIQARVDTAMGELKTQAEAIFGKTGDTGTSVAFKINNGDSTDTKGANVISVHDDKGKDRTVLKTTSAGTFGTYIGYAPELKSNPDVDNSDMSAGMHASLLVEGTGEQGRLIGWYEYFAARASKGWSEQDKTFYNKKLYDDRNSWIKSPTLKDVAMTGVGIAATLATGGMGATLLGAVEAAGITAASSIGTDALFTAADVAHGADASSSWGNFGVRSLSTVATSALGVVGGQVMGQAAVYGANGALKTAATGLMAIQGAEGVLARGALQVTEGLASRAASTSINAIHFGPGGSVSYDSQGLASQWSTTDSNGNFSLANYSSSIGTIAQIGVSNGLQSFVSSDGLGKGLSGVWDQNSIGSFTSLAGGLASSAVDYGLTGQATLNVANLSMLGQKNYRGDVISQGLMEMHLGGSDGFSMNLGSGGTDVSLGTLASSWEGMRESAMIGGAKIASVMGDNRGINYVNGLNAIGWSNNVSLDGTNGMTSQDLARKYIRGEINAGFTTMSGSDAGANGYTMNGNVYLDGSHVGNDAQSAAKMADLLVHEGTHLYDNQTGMNDEVLSYTNGLNMYKSVVSAYNLQADQTYINRQQGAIDHPELLQYDAQKQYMMLKNGTMYLDGDGFLKDEKGRPILGRDNKPIGAKDTADGIAQIRFGKPINQLNAEEQKQLGQLLTDSGVKYGIDSSGKMQIDTGSISGRNASISLTQNQGKALAWWDFSSDTNSMLAQLSKTTVASTMTMGTMSQAPDQNILTMTGSFALGTGYGLGKAAVGTLSTIYGLVNDPIDTAVGAWNGLGDAAYGGVDWLKAVARGDLSANSIAFGVGNVTGQAAFAYALGGVRGGTSAEVTTVSDATTTFYHGTTDSGAELILQNGIDVTYGRSNLDFGQGFYTTTDYAQALKQAQRQTARTGAEGNGTVLSYTVPNDEFQSFNNLIFPSADSSWQSFVLGGRNGAAHSFDSVTGPMLGNPKAFSSGLPPESFGNQTSFHTQTMVDWLQRYYSGKK